MSAKKLLPNISMEKICGSYEQRKMRPIKKCPKGKKRNPKTGRCKIPCGPGRAVNPRTNRCVTKSYLARQISPTVRGFQNQSLRRLTPAYIFPERSGNAHDDFKADDFRDDFKTGDFGDDFKAENFRDDFKPEGLRKAQTEEFFKEVRDDGNAETPTKDSATILELRLARLVQKLLAQEALQSQPNMSDLNNQADILEEINDLKFSLGHTDMEAEIKQKVLDESNFDITETLLDEVVADETKEVEAEAWHFSEFLEKRDLAILKMIRESVKLSIVSHQVHGLFRPGFAYKDCESAVEERMRNYRDKVPVKASSLALCGVYDVFVGDPKTERKAYLAHKASKVHGVVWSTGYDVVLNAIDFYESAMFASHGVDVNRCILTERGVWRISTFASDHGDKLNHTSVDEEINRYEYAKADIFKDFGGDESLVISNLIDYIEANMELFFVEYYNYS